MVTTLVAKMETELIRESSMVPASPPATASSPTPKGSAAAIAERNARSSSTGTTGRITISARHPRMIAQRRKGSRDLGLDRGVRNGKRRVLEDQVEDQGARG